MSHHESLSHALRVHGETRDLITGTLPPVAFRRAVDAWIGGDRATMPSASLVLIRVDWAVGDRPARPARAEASQALRLATELVVGTLRSTDLVGRIDDDTIGVLMPSTPSHLAGPVCRRIRAAVSERSGRAGMALTVSVGVASPRAEQPWALARQALVQAQAQGGDRTMLSEELPADVEARQAA